MGYLLDSEWRDGSGLEDLVTWGVHPLMKFLDMFDEEYSETPSDADEFAVFLYYQMKNILLDMDTVIDRFVDEVRGEGPAIQSQDERLLLKVSALPENKRDTVEAYMDELLATPESDLTEDDYSWYEALKKMTPFQMDQYRTFRDKAMEAIKKDGDLTKLLNQIEETYPFTKEAPEPNPVEKDRCESNPDSEPA